MIRKYHRTKVKNLLDPDPGQGKNFVGSGFNFWSGSEEGSEIYIHILY